MLKCNLVPVVLASFTAAVYGGFLESFNGEGQMQADKYVNLLLKCK